MKNIFSAVIFTVVLFVSSLAHATSYVNQCASTNDCPAVVTDLIGLFNVNDEFTTYFDVDQTDPGVIPDARCSVVWEVYFDPTEVEVVGWSSELAQPDGGVDCTLDYQLPYQYLTCELFDNTPFNNNPIQLQAAAEVAVTWRVVGGDAFGAIVPEFAEERIWGEGFNCDTILLPEASILTEINYDSGYVPEPSTTMMLIPGILTLGSLARLRRK